MTFRERLYIVRKNDMPIDWKRYGLVNPLDWSVRIIVSAILKLLFLLAWPIVYWPFSVLGAISLKTRYVNENDKTWFHSNMEVLR